MTTLLAWAPGEKVRMNIRHAGATMRQTVKASASTAACDIALLLCAANRYQELHRRGPRVRPQTVAELKSLMVSYRCTRRG